MNAKSLLAILLLGAASLAPAAHATVIDFNHLAGTNVPGSSARYISYTEFYTNTTFTNNGFNFVGTNNDFLMGNAYSNNDANVYAYNGTDFLMAAGKLTISSATASPFKVSSLDLVGWSSMLTQATLTGTKVDGATVMQVINLSAIPNSVKRTGNDFTTFALSGFDNLSSLSITHTGNAFLAMDNLVVNSTSVPEPSSLALFGLAMAGCVFMRRRAAKAS
jgi:hypothetical protein